MRWKTVICLGLGGVLLSACGSRVDRAEDLSKIRILQVTPVISASLSDAGSRLEPAIQAAAARSLSAKGYAIGTEADAQAYVRIAWILGRDIAPDGRDERTLSLSLSVFSRSGDRLYSGRSVQGWPERMWSEDRAVTEIANMLRDVPECRSVMVPVDGKPALAPIRLK